MRSMTGWLAGRTQFPITSPKRGMCPHPLQPAALRLQIVLGRRPISDHALVQNIDAREHEHIA